MGKVFSRLPLRPFVCAHLLPSILQIIKEYLTAAVLTNMHAPQLAQLGF